MYIFPMVTSSLVTWQCTQIVTDEAYENTFVQLRSWSALLHLDLVRLENFKLLTRNLHLIHVLECARVRGAY